LAALTDAVAAGGLDGYALVPAVRADLQRRAGRASAAAAEYRVAIQRAGTGPEQRLLQRRLDELTKTDPEDKP
jgi:RNA polymerase sigma-70 factor (ECF subfamily)